MNESTRKAAILIDTLDLQSADALLDQMNEELAAQIREAVMDLRDVDPAERDRIVQQFMGGPKTPADDLADGVELDPSLVTKLASRPDEPVANIVEDSAPFRFLHETTGESLAALLQHEHPQTVAVVVSNLPSARAADMVGRLSPDLQADVLSRVADLDETDPEIIQEIEREIQTSLESELRMTQRRTAGVAAVRSILEAADTIDRDVILSNLSRHDTRLAAQIDPRRPDVIKQTETKIAEKLVPDVAANKSKVAKQSFAYSRVKSDSRSGVRPTSDDEMPRVVPKRRDASRNKIEVSFEDLANVDDGVISQILRAADPSMTILALTGAKPQFVDRIMRKLPSREAKQLRIQMQTTGPLRLSDVDHAQKYLADLAASLAAEGKIRLAVFPRFAAAA